MYPGIKIDKIGIRNTQIYHKITEDREDAFVQFVGTETDYNRELDNNVVGLCWKQCLRIL
jgi:hypothetical protein